MVCMTPIIGENIIFGEIVQKLFSELKIREF